MGVVPVQPGFWAQMPLFMRMDIDKLVGGSGCVIVKPTLVDEAREVIWYQHDVDRHPEVLLLGLSPNDESQGVCPRAGLR